MTSWEMSDGFVVTDNAPLGRKYNSFYVQYVSNVYSTGGFHNMSIFIPYNSKLILKREHR